MFRKIIKWASLLVGGVIALLLIGNAIFVWRTDAEVERRLQAIRDAGEPVLIADLAREPIAAEENAASFFQRAHNELLALESELQVFFETDAWENQQFSVEDIETMKQMLDERSAALLLIDQAAACPDYDPQPDCSRDTEALTLSVSDQIKIQRRVMRALELQTIVLVSQGRRNEALEKCVEMLLLSRRFGKTPGVIGFLVSIACQTYAFNSANRVLRSGPIDDDVRATFETELAANDLLRVGRDALISERAFGLSSFQEFPLGKTQWFFRGFANQGTLHYLDVMDGAIADMSEPVYTSMASSSAPASTSRNPWRGMAELLLIAVDATRTTMQRTRARSACARILNRITALEQQGVEVAELADLGLPEEVALDPFSGQPLLMKKLPQGWIVYSVGKDREDDGGQFEKDEDIGLAPCEPIPSVD